MLELSIAGLSIVVSKIATIAVTLLKPAAVVALCCLFLPFGIAVAALWSLPRLQAALASSQPAASASV